MTLPVITIDGVKLSHFWGMMTPKQQSQCEKVVQALHDSKIRIPNHEMWALEWQFEKGYDRVEVVIAPWHDGLWRLQIAARETSEGLKPYDKFMFHIVVLDLCYDEFHYDQLVTDFITTTQDLSRGKDDAAHD